jgi:hypothetical protein
MWQLKGEATLDLRDTEEATRRKFEKDNAPKTKKGRRRKAMELPAIQRAAEPLLAPLIKYFEESRAPKWLAPLIEVARVAPLILAGETIGSVLDHIYQGRNDRDWCDDDDDEADSREVGMLVKKDMGERLRSQLASIPAPKGLTDWDDLTDWDNEKRVEAGIWMMKGVPKLACIRLNRWGEPKIADGCKIDVDALRDLQITSTKCSCRSLKSRLMIGWDSANGMAARSIGVSFVGLRVSI